MNPYQQLKVAIARSDPAAFAAHTVKDATTGEAIKLAKHHRAMHSLWSKHERVVLWAFAEAGKSTMLGPRLPWELGRNPSLRINVVSGTLAQAQKVAASAAQIISTPECAQVFPKLVIESTREGSFTVAGRKAFSKDASVTPSGLGAGSVLGSRFDLIVGDDLLDLESTRTQAGRDAAWQKFTEVHLSRLAPGGRVWISGTAWNVDDLLERAAKLPGWTSRRFPVLDSHGRSTWPERWPLDRIELRRQELRHAFTRVMMCVPIDEASLIFPPELVDRALANGLQAHLSPIGGRIVLGVDCAWSLGPNADESAIIMVSIDAQGFRYVTHIEAGKMSPDRLTDRVVDLARMNRATAYVESNSGGAIIAGNIAKRAPCRPLHTSDTSKRSRVEALSAEMASGRWVFCQPTGQPSRELRLLCQELEAFSFEQHMGDRCAALLCAVEGARAVESKPKGRYVRLDVTSR